MDKSASRSSYTRRILEIVRNIGKQRDEINKVLDDTHILQKELNTVTEKLVRTYVTSHVTSYVASRLPRNAPLHSGGPRFFRFCLLVSCEGYDWRPLSLASSPQSSGGVDLLCWGNIARGNPPTDIVSVRKGTALD
jgi:hypothetical protein